MLNEDIIYAREADERIENREYVREVLTGLEAEKAEFKQIRFSGCRLNECTFDKGDFLDTVFENCDLSNSRFRNAYFKNCRFTGCRMEGASFASASFKSCVFEKCGCAYCSFVSTLWENTNAEDCDLQKSFFSEAVLRKPVFRKVNFAGTDFFRTKLKGIDLSECVITDIMVSDTYAELAGLKVNVMQAAELAKLLGVRII